MSVIISKDLVREPLFCLVPLFNCFRWKSKYKHTVRALKHFAESGVVIVLVEAAFNRRELVFADSGLDNTLAECALNGGEFRHKYIPLRTKEELWLKENLINIGVSALPYNWQQVCWLDSDVHFVRPNWVGEAIQKLQHYKFIQMFSHARDLGPNYEVLPEDHEHADGPGFIKAFYDGTLDALNQPGKVGYYPPDPPYMVGRVWPGLAWACTHQAWDEVGGLIDFAVWGGGDHHMAYALIDDPYKCMMRNDLHPNYLNLVTQWMERCKRYIRRNVGFIEGSVFHNWHGRKTERGYNAKHSLLAQIGFDPLRHLKRDYQGLWQLHDDYSETYIQLRDTMRRIAKERNEDSIDTGVDELTQGH